MSRLYPLKFEPVFKSAIWGGHRLRPLLGYPRVEDPIGEAWLLSDVDSDPSRVRNGSLANRTLRELLQSLPEPILGRTPLIQGRFPLLLKLIDAKSPLSVQVHPNDEQARTRDQQAAGKTEAWVILESNPEASQVYAGFKPGMTAEAFLQAMATKNTPDTLHAFTPKKGDCLFLEAGTVHAIGADLLIFEVQQTSDITYRLYDWDRVDHKTGKPRMLHIEEGLACSDFARGPVHPRTPRPVESGRAELVRCPYFSLHHLNAAHPLSVGSSETCTALVCTEGHAMVAGEMIAPGEVLLLPAALGQVEIQPLEEVTLFECVP